MKRKASAASQKTAEIREIVVVEEIAGESLPRAPVLRAKPSSLVELKNHGYTQDEIHMFVVPKRTLARRRDRSEPLSVEETDKALRLERVAALAENVFGDPEKARRWLRKPKDALEGKAPLVFLGSEAGARVVEDMLHRIDHGIMA